MPPPVTPYLLLGPVSALLSSGVAPVRGRRQSLLFALLALRAGSPVDTGWLTESLWRGNPPRDPENSLQSQVSRLRRFLEGAQVRFICGGYMLEVPACEVDALRMDSLCAQARRWLSAGGFAMARACADDALTLWRGEPMADLHDCESVRLEARRLAELRLDATLVRAEADLSLGLHTEVVAPMRRLVAENPLREDLWATLVLALYRGGRSADALDAYRQARSILVRELGLEPGPRLRELERGILTRSPRLSSPAPPCSAHAPLLAGPLTAGFRLDLPPAAGPAGPPPGWSDYPATRLFLERARSVRPELMDTLGAREGTQIVTLCRLLEGEPLAIELAAASMRATTLTSWSSSTAGPCRRGRPHSPSRRRTAGFGPPEGADGGLRPGSAPAGRNPRRNVRPTAGPRPRTGRHPGPSPG